MTVRGNPGNQKQFPTLSTALGNRSAIPAFPQPRRTEAKWKANSRLPTCLGCYSFSQSNQKTQEKDASRPSFRSISRLILQATKMYAFRVNPDSDSYHFGNISW